MDKLDTLFCCATFFEAKSILDIGGFAKVERDFFRKYNYGLLITGIGPEKVDKAFKKRPWLQFNKIVNLGFCAGVKGLKVGDFFIPQQVLGLNELQNNNIIYSHLLLSLAEPLKKNHFLLKNNSFLQKAELIGADMESLALKKATANASNELIINKIVTDIGKEDFFNNFQIKKNFFLDKLHNVAKKHL